MSFHINIILTVVAATTLILIFFKHLLNKVTSVSSKRTKLVLNLPPGDMGLPWLGETMDFYRSQRNNRLFEDFVRPRIAKHGSIFKTRLMGSPTIVVNGAEANRFFLSNEFKLVVSSWPASSVQLMGENSIMEAKGHQHRTVRGLIATALSYSGLEALVPKMCKLVQSSLAEHWDATTDEISLYRWTKNLTFAIVFECLLGMEVRPGMVEVFERVLEGVFEPAVGFPGSKFWGAKRARVEIKGMLVEVVREKRKELEAAGGEEDEEGQLLMWRLVKAVMEGEVTEEEVVDNVVLLVFAAHDTTSYAIAMTFRMLARHPDCYHLVLQEHMEIKKKKEKEGGMGNLLSLEEVKRMKYTWDVARESMRLFPPIFGSFRKAIHNIHFGGYTIPKGWKVLWTAYGTHYSEEYFEEAMSFKPRRFQEQKFPPYAYVPFGGGPRICAGSQLAKLNILVLLHCVVTAYDWSLVFPEEQIRMDPLPFPSHGMPIRVSPKSP